MTDDAENLQRDYRETVFLPQTPFPMRAGLPQPEPRDPRPTGATSIR